MAVSETAKPNGKGGRSWRRALTELAVLLILTILWAQFAAAALKYGWAWTWFGHRLGLFDDRAVERCLFEADPDTEYGCLVIGSPSFLTGVRTRLPGGIQALEIEIPLVTLPAVTAAAKAGNRMKYRTVLVQNRPYFWTDLRMKDVFPEQTTDLWQKYGSTHFSWLPLEESRILFEAAGQWVRGLGLPVRSPPERSPASLLNASFDFERIRRTYFIEDQPFGPKGTGQVFWITDRRFPPPDMDPSIMKRFEQVFATGKGDSALGRFIEINEVRAAVEPEKKTGHAD